WAAFEAARPRSLGALLDAVCVALRDWSRGCLAQLPRLADFAVWATAGLPACGIEPATFEATWQAARHAATAVAIEASAVARAVHAFVAAVHTWDGTASA